MFEKNLKLAFLLDFYGEILDEHTRAVMKSYYDDDLSLSEIADGLGISRQGVRHIVKKGGDELEFFEKKLGLANKNAELDAAVKKLIDLKNRTDIKALQNYSEIADGLNEVIGIISDNTASKSSN